MDTKKLTNIYQNYKRHSIDKTIVEVLQSRDRAKFWNSDKIFFFKELWYMLKWWVWLIQAIKTIRQWSTDFALKEIADCINKNLTMWHSLSYSLNRLPDYFDEWDVNIIKAWEKSWSLVVVLESLAQEYEYMADIKNKYVWALVYPIILIVIAVVAVIALFGFVLPPVFDIAAWFSTSELPTMTRLLKWFSDFLVNGWKFILAVFAAAALGIWIYLSTEKWKKSRFRFLLSVPLIWNMTKYYYLVKRCRYMRLMLISWMNYVETFKTLRDVLRIPAYQDMIERVLAGLQRWETIYSSIRHESDLVPSNAVVLIRVWEETANLQNSLWNILTIYKEELDSTIDRLSKVIEPIMLVFIGALVAIIATWVFGIIYQLMEWI